MTELKDKMLQLVEKCRYQPHPFLFVWACHVVLVYRNFDFCKAANFLNFDDMKKELSDSFEAISKH